MNINPQILEKEGVNEIVILPCKEFIEFQALRLGIPTLTYATEKRIPHDNSLWT